MDNVQKNLAFRLDYFNDTGKGGTYCTGDEPTTNFCCFSDDYVQWLESQLEAKDKQIEELKGWISDNVGVLEIEGFDEEVEKAENLLKEK